MKLSEAERALVVLSVHPQLDEQMVDWLLRYGAGTGFSSFPIRGHSGDHQHLSVAEQVSGRQKRQRFEIAMDIEAAPEFLRQLVAEFGGADVHYWVMPILVSRDLNSERS
jgi:hypothetical protein